MKDVYVLSAVRSPIGGFDGSLSGVEPIDLGTTVMKEAVIRSGIDSSQISSVVVGNCIPTESRSPYLSRVIAINSGLPHKSSAITINRLCGSAMQAIVSAAQGVMLGDYSVAIGGGVEVMSKGGFLSPDMRHGKRMGNAKMIDLMVAVLTDPFGVGHMGVTAENLSKKWNITREMQDEFALESQNRAKNAIAKGLFKDEIVPITIKQKRSESIFDTDEHPRNTSLEKLASMKPAFLRELGTVTAGNSSGINDGASFVLLGDDKTAAKEGVEPIARMVSYAVEGVPSDVMGEGPIPATKAALKKANLTLEQIDVIESNEAFAAQALAVQNGLGFDASVTNINGGAIALGHPVGATGAILVTKALHELNRKNGKYALATMCIGGGQGITTIFERV
jgi:acetyl-CoA C-acetyltransferase